MAAAGMGYTMPGQEITRCAQRRLAKCVHFLSSVSPQAQRYDAKKGRLRTCLYMKHKLPEMPRHFGELLFCCNSNFSLSDGF